MKKFIVMLVLGLSLGLLFSGSSTSAKPGPNIPSVAATGSSSLSGDFVWSVSARGLEPGHQYQSMWYWRSEDGTKEYWLGSNEPPVRPNGNLLVGENTLDDLTDNSEQVSGYFEVWLYEPSEPQWKPATGPDGNPLIFSQEIE